MVASPSIHLHTHTHQYAHFKHAATAPPALPRLRLPAFSRPPPPYTNTQRWRHIGLNLWPAACGNRARTRAARAHTLRARAPALLLAACHTCLARTPAACRTRTFAYIRSSPLLSLSVLAALYFCPTPYYALRCLTVPLPPFCYFHMPRYAHSTHHATWRRHAR